MRLTTITITPKDIAAADAAVAPSVLLSTISAYSIVVCVAAICYGLVGEGEEVDGQYETTSPRRAHSDFARVELSQPEASFYQHGSLRGERTDQINAGSKHAGKRCQQECNTN